MKSNVWITKSPLTILTEHLTPEEDVVHKRLYQITKLTLSEASDRQLITLLIQLSSFVLIGLEDQLITLTYFGIRKRNESGKI